MQLSSNYGLKLMEGTDNVKRQDFVDNFTKIDLEMKAINDNGYPSLTATGTNAYVGSTDRMKSLGKGTKLTLFVGTDSTGNCSLNLNAYGAKNIKDSFGNIVTNLKANIPYNLCYNGTDFILQGKGGGGDANPNQVVLGKKFTNDSGQQTGTLDLTNLITENIKNGVTINGVTGKSTVVDTSDAVLDPAYLVTGNSGYDDGVKKSGTLPIIANNTPPSSIAYWAPGASGNTYAKAHFLAPRGYYDGNTWLSQDMPDLLATNIVAGKSIVGVAGTATIASLGGEKYATGTVIASSDTILTTTEGSSINCYYANITGHNFNPKFVILEWIGSPSSTHFFVFYTALNSSFAYLESNATSRRALYQNTASTWICNSSTIRLPLAQTGLVFVSPSVSNITYHIFE